MTTISGSFEVSSGHDLADADVVEGGIVFVDYGGVASAVTVSSGGQMSLGSLGVASGATVSSGGLILVGSGGVDDGAVVENGGTENILGGVSNESVVNGGVQEVSGGENGNGYQLDVGEINDATVYNGGISIVSANGEISDASVGSDGLISISSGGFASAVTVASGGKLYFDYGAVGDDISVSGGGILYLTGFTPSPQAYTGANIYQLTLAVGAEVDVPITSASAVVTPSGEVLFVTDKGALIAEATVSGGGSFDVVTEPDYSDFWGGGIGTDFTIVGAPNASTHNSTVNALVSPAAVTVNSSGSSFAIRGTSMLSYGATNYEGTYFDILENQFQETVSDGSNFVQLGGEGEINPSTGALSLGNDIPVGDVGSAIAAAEADGLQVFLKPQISSTSTGYTGSLENPATVISNPAKFFSNYESFIVKYAQLAQEYNVPILSIGTEMVAATKPEYTKYWDKIIAAVRAVYSGSLTYDAEFNTSSSVDEVQQIGFWNKLNYATFDVYPTISPTADPTVSQLNAAWINDGYVQAITQDALLTGLPVIFGETGIQSTQGANGVFPLTGGTTADYNFQANWWQSFFDTWGGAKTPSWLAGVFVYNQDPAETPEGDAAYNSETPQDDTDQNSFSITGKPAEAVIASAFGGGDYLGAQDAALTGSDANDQLYLYGNANLSALQSANNGVVTLPETLTTNISIQVFGSIINGQTPTIDLTADGVDLGAHTLSTSQVFVYGVGNVPMSITTLDYTVPGLVDINNLTLALDGPVMSGSPYNSEVAVDSVDINGVFLSTETYQPLNGTTQTVQINQDFYMSDGGTVTFDTTPWNTVNNAVVIGDASDPIQVNGGGGTDTVHVLGDESQYTITNIGPYTYTLSEDSGLDQNAVLTGITYVSFEGGETIVLPDAATVDQVADDVTGQGISSFIIKTAGAIGVGGLDATGQAEFQIIGSAPSDWHIRGAGDFYGTGVDELLIQTNGGSLELGTVNDGSIAYTRIGTLGSEWQVDGVGDFLGESTDQFLIENAGGGLKVGQINANGQLAYTDIGLIEPQWTIEGVGDFLGDNNEQILMRNSIGIVDVAEVGPDGKLTFQKVGAVSSAVTFEGVGDFLGNGQDQFLIENAAGVFELGSTGSAGELSYGAIGKLGPDWAFEGVGSFTGTGPDSAIFENTATGALRLGTVVAGQWQYSSIGDLATVWNFHNG